MQVSACLIVRNEENNLGRCLDSICQHVDEIVLVDTGSRDRTREVARHYTTRLFEFPWRSDFAAARQFSFDRATREWVFWLDADDVVHNAARIRTAIAEAPSDVNCFYWKYLAGQDEYGNSTCEFWRERCVRNDRSFRWVGRVHEVLMPRSRLSFRRDENVTVVHHPEPESADGNPRRNLEILQREYSASRGRPSARLLYYLGSEHADLGQFDLAIEYLQRYVRISQWREEKYLALLRVADLHRLRGGYADAIGAALEAFDVIPEWPNACFSLAETFYFQRDWPQVVGWAEAGQVRSVPDTVCVINPLALRYSWIIHYTNALFHMGRVRDALEWTERALAICPNEHWHLANRQFFSDQLRNAQAACMNETAQQDATSVAQKLHSAPFSLVWHGPLFDPSGYAEEGREFVMALDSLGMSLRIVPFSAWCSTQAVLPRGEFATLRRLIQAPIRDTSAPLVSLFHMVPSHYHHIDGAAYHIGRTMCETDRIPESWIAPCNAMDEIWVPCEHNIETFSRSGVERSKLLKMPQGLNLQRYNIATTPMPMPGGRRFNFLAVFEWTLRKGWDVLVRAFAAEFRPRDNVALILKTGATSGHTLNQLRQTVVTELRTAQLARNLPANIVLFPSNLNAEQMPALYRGAHAFVLPSRGEGWGRPLMEAMLMGLPTIGTRWSGPLEFMNDDNSYLVDCEVVDVPEVGWREQPIYRGHRWAEPSVAHLRRVMRQVVEDYADARRRGEAAREHISTNFNRQTIAAQVRARLHGILMQK